MYFDKICSVETLSTIAGNTNKEKYQAAVGLGAVPINIQPASAELIAISDGAYGKTFLAFVRTPGIEIGNRITISGSNTKYIVKGRSNWQFGPLPHDELVLFLGDN